MNLGEFREDSSPWHSLNIKNVFHGDGGRFSFNSSSDYSLSSSFSNGLYSSEDSTCPFDSPPFNGFIPKQNHEKSVSGGDDLGYRMKIVEEDYERPDNTYFTLDPLWNSEKSYEPSNSGFFSGCTTNDSWWNNTGFNQRQNDDKRRNMFGNNPHQIPDSIANYRQVGWPSYGGGNAEETFGEYSAFSPPQQQLDVSYNNHHSYKTTTTSDMFSQEVPSWSASKDSVLLPSSFDESFFTESKSIDHQRSDTRAHHGKATELCYPSLPEMCDIQGYVYLMAKDQHGCRFLQRIFDQGTSVDAMIIFNEVLDHVVELMMDPFGNYLMQKLLDVCTEEQRTQIVLVATAQPGQLIRISLNAYGTRVVQRLVETIRTGKQICLVKSALRPGFLDLIKDLNGNHVIQRCLQCLSIEDNKFIFDAATKFCTEIATHRHGCCVLQKCIAYSMKQQREKLIDEISRNSLHLAQDPFGNYAVQFVIELRIPSAVSMMLSRLKGHYVQLSMQKFSSHMVERCLMHCPESRPQIVRELVSIPHFDQLLQDPYANFVIQAALNATKGPLHASLVEVIKPHSILRNNPYCKRIFSRNLLKK